MNNLKQVTSEELITLLNSNDKDYQFIDVRSPMEYRSGKIERFENIPLQNFEYEMNRLDKSKAVVLICESGSRSLSAARYLARLDFSEVINVKGGISKFR